MASLVFIEPSIALEVDALAPFNSRDVTLVFKMKPTEIPKGVYDEVRIELGRSKIKKMMDTATERLRAIKVSVPIDPFVYVINSEYMGVSYIPKQIHKPWRCLLRIPGERVVRQSFSTEEAAALHYNKLIDQYGLKLKKNVIHTP